jgi:hypothetical protein
VNAVFLCINDVQWLSQSGGPTAKTQAVFVKCEPLQMELDAFTKGIGANFKHKAIPCSANWANDAFHRVNDWGWLV